jgi:hypothetical protein
MTSKLKPQEFHQAISRLLNEKLKPLITEEKSLNLVTCTDIYTTIFEAMTDVIRAAELPLSNEAANWLSQTYYDGILVNGNQELDGEIFTKRASLDNLPTSEITLMAVLLNGTDFALPLIEEVKRRS